MSLSSTPEGGFARPSGKTPPPPAPSAAYAKRQVALFTCFQRLLTVLSSARELQAQESMAAARYRPPALRNAKDTPENISGGDVGGDPVALAPPSFPQGFRRARAGTLPSNVQLAAQRYASTLPAAPVSDYETNEISNNTGINLNTGAANARPSLRHATSMAPSVPSATIGGERNSRLRSGSLTLPSAGLSNAFGSSIFTSSWLPNNTGFPALDEMRSITSGDSITGGDEYDVHTLDYLGLDDGPSSIGGHGRPMPMPATVSELRNQAQAAIVGHQAQNPSRNRSQTISNFARARSGTTSMITAPTIEHSDDEEEIDYAAGGNYGRQRMDSFEGGLYGGNSGYPAKSFRQSQHLSPNTSLLARPRAISVGILDDPNRAAAQRRTAAANAAIEQSSGSLHRKASFSNMNDVNQGILNTNAVYTAAPTSILRQPSFSLDDENSAMYAGRLNRQNSASVRFPSGDVTAGQMGNNGGRQVHLSAPIIGRGESRSVSPKMDGPSQIQTPSRSLWIGNLDPTMTGEDLAHVFAPYGAIESFRLLPEKECGFVNFVDIADAMRAKDDVLNRLSGHIGMNNNQAVRIGFGKADSAPATPPMGAQTSTAGAGLGAHIQSQFTPPGQMTPNQNQANAMDSQLQSSPTRALWIGSIPSTTTPATILSVFSPYGPIESARVLTHKNCGFVNFERLDDAVRARKALNGRDVLGSDVGAIRIGFARVPVKNSGSGDGVDEGMGAGVQGVGDLTVGATIHALRTVKGAATIPADQQVLGGSIENYRSNLLLSMIGSGTHKALGGNSNSNNNGAGWTAAITEQQMIMLELSGGSADAEADIKALGDFRPPTMYYSTIPLVAERPHNRRWDASKLRELRKRLDSGTCSVEEIDAVAADFLDGEIVDLASDWLGNTVVQKLFEKCSPAPRLAMLDRIAPHLAMIGIHKNGTWAAQKIIECATTPEEIALVSTNLRPYAPPLLLDQFGNYVVQCCLRFGSPANDFIFDAVVDRLWEVAQGRFGARSMRACLESPQITASQQRKIATAIVLNSIPLATNPNGALLLTWLLDSSGFQSRYKLLAPRFTPHLAHLCTHKLASLTVLRIVNQRIEPDASQQIVRSLFNSPGDHVLTDVLGDQVNGVSVVHKILISPFIDAAERPQYLEATKRVLIDLKVTVTQAYRRLIEEVGLPLPNFQPTFAQPVPQPAKKNSGGPTAPYGMPGPGYQQPGDGLANMMQALQMQPGVGHNSQAGLQINPGYGGPGVPGPMSAGPPSGTSPATFSPTNDPFNPFARSPDMAPRGNRRGPPGGQYVPQQGQQMYNAQQGTPSLAQAGSGLMGMGQPPYGMPPNPMPPNPMPPQMYQAYMQNFVQPNSTAFHA